MFKVIDFSLKNTGYCDIDNDISTDLISAPNIKYKSLKDGSVDFSSENDIPKADEFFDCLKFVSKNFYLQLEICKMFFFKRELNISPTSSLVCSALNANEAEISDICALFESVIFDEAYPIFKDGYIQKCVSALQVTGLSSLGEKAARHAFKSDSTLNLLYNSRIKNDADKTACYEFYGASGDVGENEFKSFADKIFENKYLSSFGNLVVTALSLEELENHGLCAEISKRVQKLYLLTYDMEYNGTIVYQKCLQWYL